MIQFKKLKYKNFLSTGNSPIEIQLNSAKHTLIVGKNGFGKCLHPSTKIKVRAKNKKVEKEFKKFLKTNAVLNQLEVEIIDVVKFYRLYPEYIGQLEVDSQYGYYTIEYADVTAYNSEVYELKTKNKIINTSPDHLLFGITGWEKVRNLNVDDKIKTVDGYEKIISIKKLENKETLYDLQVEKVHEFYANGIVSHNSSITDALSFVLFGKAHRNINKPQLVNSINKKDCLVEVEFDIGKTSYKVIRGIAPTVFEIWKNGKLINQDSHAKEYQKYLERNIIKLNHKSFHQIVVLGSSSFIPFMQLPAGSRREVIEDLLDINVFSKMNMILKQENSELRSNLENIDHQIEIEQTKQKSQIKYIEDIIKINEVQYEKKQNEINDLQDQIKIINKKIEKNNNIINKINPVLQEKLKSLHDDKQTLLQQTFEINSEIKRVVKEAKFFETNDNCPKCQQEIDQDTKQVALDAISEKARILKEKKNDKQEKGTSIENEIKKANKCLLKIQSLQNENSIYLNQISTHQSRINVLESELTKVNSKTDSVDEAKQELTKIRKTIKNLKQRKKNLSEQYTYNNAMIEMLKDTGIKTKIIRQYIPIINNLVNQYLQTLDFFVSFHLDDSFSETIKSRHRDSFSYQSFSEGEKQRIDLALLFTWRQIAKMKNSVSTNLLILDETMDNSLDNDGVENLMKILYSLPDDTNTFVISHKGDILDGKFEKTIEFNKTKNFSSINYIT